jgi:hypothetical protein
VIIADIQALLVRVRAPRFAAPGFWPSLLRSLHDRNYECILKVKNLPQFSTEARSEPYFCLDTSLNRTLAYAHWCNWGNVLESINTCSHSRFADETVSALCAAILHRPSPSLERSGPAHDLDAIAGGNFVSPPQQKLMTMALLLSRSSSPKYHLVVLKRATWCGRKFFFAAVSR